MSPEIDSLLAALPVTPVGEASPRGLVLPADMDRDTWSSTIASIAQLAGRISRHRETLTAWLGDLLAYGDGKYRGQITEYATAAGLDPGTLRVAKLVCSRIPVLCRHNGLSWSHHCEVGRAFKDPTPIKHWLDLAADERLSVRQLRRRIRLHLAERQPVAPPVQTSGKLNAPFAVLRELRTVGRIITKHRPVWTEWAPATCELALAELDPLIQLIEALRARSGSPRGSSRLS